MIGKLTSDDIARLWPADTAALLTAGRKEVAGCSDISKAQRLVDAYDRWLADLLLEIDPLPPGHPTRRAAIAKIRAVRPQRMQAEDDLLACKSRIHSCWKTRPSMTWRGPERHARDRQLQAAAAGHARGTVGFSGGLSAAVSSSSSPMAAPCCNWRTVRLSAAYPEQLSARLRPISCLASAYSTKPPSRNSKDWMGASRQICSPDIHRRPVAAHSRRPQVARSRRLGGVRSHRPRGVRSHRPRRGA